MAKSAAIERALDRPDPAIRCYLLYGPDESGSRALAKRLEARAGRRCRADRSRARAARAPIPRCSPTRRRRCSLFGGARHIRVEGVDRQLPGGGRGADRGAGGGQSGGADRGRAQEGRQAGQAARRRQGGDGVPELAARPTPISIGSRSSSAARRGCGSTTTSRAGSRCRRRRSRGARLARSSSSRSTPMPRPTGPSR